MADKKYLDTAGLTKLWQLIKAKIPSKYASSQSEGGAADKAVSIPFGQVDSTSTATAFTATIDGITELRDGVCVYLRNGVITSASGFTININNLGAKPCYSTLAAASRSTTIFNINYTMLFVYNSSRVSGGCWDVFYGYDSNTNTIGYQLRTNSTTLPMSEKVYRYRLLFTSADGTKWVPANTSTSTNATASRTVNQTKINPFGKIVYYGYTTAIDAGSSPGASYMWTQYVVTLGYSFNNTGVALTLTPKTPVYLKCAPQSDGCAIIDANNPYVQTLPSTADGKIYIFLGIAVDATTMELIPEHPVYCYRNGRIQIWTGLEAYMNTPEMDGQGNAGSGTAYALGNHQHPTDTSRSPVIRYKTLTLATSDWSAVTGGYSCSKTVTGMTSTAIVWLDYSDTESDFSASQSANTLTFTIPAVPSTAVTVNLSFVEGVNI